MNHRRRKRLRGDVVSKGSKLLVTPYFGAPGRAVVSAQGKHPSPPDDSYKVKSERVPCRCWCDCRTLAVPLDLIRAGKTLTCGRTACHEGVVVPTMPDPDRDVHDARKIRIPAVRRRNNPYGEFNDEAIVAVVALVKLGESAQDIALRIGVSPNTVAYWCDPMLGDGYAQELVHQANLLIKRGWHR